MANELVSVIVPCYKQAQFLPETLDSVLAQTYSNWECIIVNDGSPDNTEEVANEYCQKDSRFRYIYQRNSGLAIARNTGIHNSFGTYILPLDSDDIIACSYIEKAIIHFRNHPETKLVYCKADLFGQENGPWDLPVYKYEDFIWKNSIFCSAIYRRSDYVNTPGYNANMHYGLEDWDYYLSLLKKGDIVYQIDETLFHYRTKSGSMITELNLEKRNSMLTQIYQNHPDIYVSYANQIILLHRTIQDLKSEINNLELANNQLQQVKKSNAYRIGKVILRPINWLKRTKYK